MFGDHALGQGKREIEGVDGREGRMTIRLKVGLGPENALREQHKKQKKT